MYTVPVSIAASTTANAAADCAFTVTQQLNDSVIVNQSQQQQQPARSCVACQTTAI
jgi:hypothetical protein